MPDPYWEKVRLDAEKARAERLKNVVPAKDLENSTKAGVGKRKWICLDCKSEAFEHWVKVNRAARLRCPSCGSLRYEMKTKDAKDDAADLRAFVEPIRDDPSGTGSGHFVKG